MGCNYPGWKLAGWQFSGWELSWVEIVQVGVILSGNFPSGNCPGRSYPWWEFSGWELSWVGIFFGGGFPGGNCPVGIIRVRVFMFPLNMSTRLIFESKYTFCLYQCSTFYKRVRNSNLLTFESLLSKRHNCPHLFLVYPF